MHIDGKTQLIGLLGWPVSHSFSPAMHNAAAQALDINWLYVPLPVQSQDLLNALRGLPALGFRGVNVTVPHKQKVMPFLDDVDESARAIGAVNTILIKQQSTGSGSKWILTGTNTDWVGFLTDLKRCEVKIDRRDCLVLGAGGSARAVVYGLLYNNARVHVLARRYEQAQQLAKDFQDTGQIETGSLADLPSCLSSLTSPLIVNTTPLGMTPKVNDSVWPDRVLFPNDAFAYDLVYNPRQTRFIRQAIRAGCRTSNGLGMLIQQGAHAFELWTGYKPDVEVMSSALNLTLY
ncbi:MAG: shikimate dehydrogenase [Candidatus Promineifilaceae bacterium]|nr:shikimate dehydrogenase [Candidatus Promineifilaceae bacterium]